MNLECEWQRRKNQLPINNLIQISTDTRLIFLMISKTLRFLLGLSLMLIIYSFFDVVMVYKFTVIKMFLAFSNQYNKILIAFSSSKFSQWLCNNYCFYFIYILTYLTKFFGHSYLLKRLKYHSFPMLWMII